MENHRRARLIVISGLPGTGKSTVAQRVAATLPAAHVSIDEVEEALLSCGVERGWTAGVAAYEAASAAAVTSLKAGVDVVINAVNDSEAARETWRRAARDTNAELHFSLLVCLDPAIHRNRLDGRYREFVHVGEPSWVVTLERREEYAPWADSHLLIDTAFCDADGVVTRLLLSLPRRTAPGAPHHIESIRHLTLARQSAVKARPSALVQLQALLITALNSVRERITASSGADKAVQCLRLRADVG